MPESLDCTGLKCPQPILKLAIKANQLPPGSTIEVKADCSRFPDDVHKWCHDMGKDLLNLVARSGVHTATIRL